jgi:sporulation protein YlmC with PRC-barrel domain
MKSFRKEDIIAKPVIETSGTVKGKVKDVTFDLSGTITLIIEGVDGKDFQVPISKVMGISDNVVVRSDQVARPISPASGLTCRFCGTPMTAGQTWCPSCGKAQA